MCPKKQGHQHTCSGLRSSWSLQGTEDFKNISNPFSHSLDSVVWQNPQDPTFNVPPWGNGLEQLFHIWLIFTQFACGDSLNIAINFGAMDRTTECVVWSTEKSNANVFIRIKSETTPHNRFWPEKVQYKELSPIKRVTYSGENMQFWRAQGERAALGTSSWLWGQWEYSKRKQTWGEAWSPCGACLAHRTVGGPTWACEMEEVSRLTSWEMMTEKQSTHEEHPRLARTSLLVSFSPLVKRTIWPHAHFHSPSYFS